ncbi:GIY-YIG nuclease family protein [Haloarcula amylovorans]|uniref:GIY-YIG nuclease family protein n=1 Tax=Haloarcula amylovorans TaxID=2562280 RepID=UPI00107641C8|nr:GIY-YIG nuclease family protein [Halomicroarcula amylolytica]
MDGGTYTLLLDRVSGGTVEVGALGDLSLPAGYYAYTGSALGGGGFSRVDRHRAVASGENDARHWHVDYLLGAAETRVDHVVTTSAAIECAVARRLGGTERFEAVESFGCSDCDCRSHLHYGDDCEELLVAVERAHGNAD